MTTEHPETIETTDQLMEVMTVPTEGVKNAVAELGGEFLVLGAGGKMGPTLCQMLIRAGASKVIAVDLYPDGAVRESLAALGCETIVCDLLDSGGLAELPDCPNVLIMAGFKFGATGNESAVWAMNTLLPGRVIERFADSRVLLMSSGNIYKFAPVTGGGSTEQDPVDPIGEYAQSRLGGERVAQYVAERQGTKLVIVRLFYAVEMRYGILHDLAKKILDDEPIDVTMGHVNQIWQGDAVGYLIQFLTIADCPARTINVTGPDILSVRELGRMFAEHMGKKARFVGTEADTALLGNSDEAFDLFGTPPTSAETVVRWMGAWVARGGESLGKPTKYERRDGKF